MRGAIKSIVLVMLGGLLFSCSEVSVPRPRGYFRIELPKHEYTCFDSVGVPYIFDVSKMSRVEADRGNGSERYWVNIVYPQLDCQVHVTYRDMRGKVEESLEDSRRLAYKHTVKAPVRD